MVSFTPFSPTSTNQWPLVSRLSLERPLILLLACCFLVLGRTGASTYGKKSWALYHSTSGDDKSFLPRGSITLEVSDEDPSSPVKIEVENREDAFNKDMVGSMAEGFYRLKLVEDGGDDSSVLASVPACQVRRANFRDELVLTLGEAGEAISLAYIPLVSPLAPKSCSDLDPPESVPIVSSKISYETAVPGMTLSVVLPGGPRKPPPGLSFLPNRNRHQPGAPDDPTNVEEGPPDSFIVSILKRYWFILLPLFLSTLFQAEEPPPRGQQQQQRTAGATIAAAGSPTRAATGGSSGSPAVRQRRGKRG